MLPTVSPLFGSGMPNELKLAFFSFLQPEERCKVEAVCKEWLTLIRDDSLWRPILQEFVQYSNTPMSNEGTSNIKSMALAEFQSRQKTVDALMSLSEADRVLASFISRPYMPLDKLKQMLPMERTIHVMRALREQDCTGLFVYLIMEHRDSVKRYAPVAVGAFREEGANGIVFLKRLMDKFYENDKYLPLLVDLIKAPPAPFNASAVVAAAVPLLDQPPAIKPFFHILGSIVSSHYDLSEFLCSDVLISSRGDMERGKKILDGILPHMDEFTPDSAKPTREDWRACGYEPSPDL